MAWGYYLNLEPIALRAARDATAKMSTTNISTLCSDYYDEASFYENLQYGYTAVVMSVSYLESSVNTIMRHIYGYEPSSKEMRSSIEDKLNLIMKAHREEWSGIKASHNWQQYKELSQVRNGLIHYKVNKADSMASAPPLGGWKIGKQTFGEFFTKPCIENYLDGIVKLLERIIAVLDLQIADGFAPLIADASGMPTNYIYCKEELFDDVESLIGTSLVDSKWRLLHPSANKIGGKPGCTKPLCKNSAREHNFISRIIRRFKALIK